MGVSRFIEFERSPVGKREVTSFRQAWPAITPCYETDIEYEEDWEEIVGYGDSYGCTDEAPVELLRMLDAQIPC